MVRRSGAPQWNPIGYSVSSRRLFDQYKASFQNLLDTFKFISAELRDDKEQSKVRWNNLSLSSCLLSQHKTLFVHSPGALGRLIHLKASDFLLLSLTRSNIGISDIDI